MTLLGAPKPGSTGEGRMNRAASWKLALVEAISRAAVLERLALLPEPHPAVLSLAIGQPGRTCPKM